MSANNEDDFCYVHLPRHEGLEAFDAATQQFRVGEFTNHRDAPAAPRTLFDMYLRDAPRVLAADAATRPEHYDDAQHEMIRGLAAGKRYGKRELDLLFLTYSEKSATAAARAALVTRITSARHGVAEEDTGPTFESQDYGPTIRII